MWQTFLTPHGALPCMRSGWGWNGEKMGVTGEEEWELGLVCKIKKFFKKERKIRIKKKAKRYTHIQHMDTYKHIHIHACTNTHTPHAHVCTMYKHIHTHTWSMYKKKRSIASLGVVWTRVEASASHNLDSACVFLGSMSFGEGKHLRNTHPFFSVCCSLVSQQQLGYSWGLELIRIALCPCSLVSVCSTQISSVCPQGWNHSLLIWLPGPWRSPHWKSRGLTGEAVPHAVYSFPCLWLWDQSLPITASAVQSLTDCSGHQNQGEGELHIPCH